MKSALNLMTDDDRRQQLLQAARQVWGRILSGTLAVLLVAGGIEWWQGRASSAKVRSLEDRYAPMQALKEECIRMRGEINAMQNAQKLTLRLVDSRPTVTLLGTISAAARATDGQVYVEQLNVQHGDATHATRTAVVMGQGKDNASIAQFTAALRDSTLFADVTLSSSDTNRATDEQARSFRIECQL